MESVVTFTDVYKEYPFYHHITAGFKSFLFHLPKNIASLRRTKFSALSGVSFEVARGETFGIIGKNGSGKSTILGLIAGVIRQDRGSLEVKGKISSLLELGAGFHPDLSGIENIILNGILMGNTKEQMLAKIDEIIEFSELGDFIYQPLRTYSSGMHVRLGFSVAVNVDPEILVVDEALAVGDLNFQEKCLKKMREFRERGATIIIVSHGMAAIAKLCDRAAWIDAGSVMAVGKPREVITKYLRYIGQEDSFTFGEDTFPHESPADDGGIPAVTGAEPNASEPAGEEVAAAAEQQELEAVLAPSEAPSRPLTWWESSTVANQCEAFISGSPDVSLYEFLGRYIPRPLEKGLSVCLKRKGLESVFVVCNTCRAFDVIDDEAAVARLLDGDADLGEGRYDLFLCTDLLHRVRNLELLLSRVARALRPGGYVIAVEYVGPAGFVRSAKEMEIADALRGILGDGDVLSEPCSSPQEPGVLGATAGTSSDAVIPALGAAFDIVEVRHFGGPLFDLVLNRILAKFGAGNGKASALLKTVMYFERVLREEGVIGQQYALVLAKKK
jgi:homopolymeric O-antigen transport system ATP-binding protein